MPRFFAIALLLLCCLIISPARADDGLDKLEAVVAANTGEQPGLESFEVRVETPRIAEMIGRLTTEIPPDVARPKPPEIVKYWQRDPYKSVVTTLEEPSLGYVAQMVARASESLAIELDRLLLPAARAAERRRLAAGAAVKCSEVALAGTLLHRVEIDFEPAADLGEAFFSKGLRLPRKQIRSLTFDIDDSSQTIGEMTVATADGLVLSVELRYQEVSGGHLPNRVRVTSPDGKVDDLLEVQFREVGGFLLPATMKRIINRPELQDELEVTFRDYKINQPPSAANRKGRSQQ